MEGEGGSGKAVYCGLQRIHQENEEIHQGTEGAYTGTPPESAGVVWSVCGQAVSVLSIRISPEFHVILRNP